MPGLRIPLFQLRRHAGGRVRRTPRWHALDTSINHVYTMPRTPGLNGQVERFHRINAKVFYSVFEGVVIHDTEVFTDKLQEFESFCN